MQLFRVRWAFPDRINAGLRVTRLGNTSVRYEIAIFSEGSEQPAAQGYFVHVYVDRETAGRSPCPVALVAALKTLVTA